MSVELNILEEYIRTQTGFRGELSRDLDLFEARILDSFNVVELAMFIQERFAIELEAEDMVRANLATLSGLISLIGRRKGVDGH